MTSTERDLAIEARREVLRIKREHLGKIVDRVAWLKDELAIAETDEERLTREVESAELELDRLAPLDARAFAVLTKAGDHRAICLKTPGYSMDSTFKVLGRLVAGGVIRTYGTGRWAFP